MSKCWRVWGYSTGYSSASALISSVSGVNFASSPVTVSDQITTLGFITDKHFTSDPHVSEICKKSLFHLRALRYIRHSFLAEDKTASIASVMVLTRLDYGNLLLSGCSISNMVKLQRIQTTAARIVLNTQRIRPSQQLFQRLHWQPVYLGGGVA